MKKKELEIIPDHETSLKLLNKDLGAVDSGSDGGVAEDLGHKVYHSTNAKFNKFDKEYIGWGNGVSFASGFYFADEPIKEYGDTLTCNISYSNPIILDLENMNSVYDYVELLNLNKETVDGYIKYRSGDVKAGLNKAIRDKYGDDLVNVTKLLQSKGYDCVIVENTTVGVKDKVKLDKEYIIFEPEQIEIVENINEDWIYTDTLLEKHKNKKNKQEKQINDNIKSEFIELPLFIKSKEALGLTEDDMRIIEEDIIKKKQSLPPLRNLKGAKKIRVKLDNNKGKSGGARVVFLEIVITNSIYLIYAFSKSNEDNLTNEEEKAILKIVKAIKGVN